MILVYEEFIETRTHIDDSLNKWSRIISVMVIYILEDLVT